jgi:hypothetical protein
MLTLRGPGGPAQNGYHSKRWRRGFESRRAKARSLAAKAPNAVVHFTSARLQISVSGVAEFGWTKIIDLEVSGAWMPVERA